MPVDISGLNEEQRAAVLHTHGPLLVLAGAGSGKTRVVTHRIARMLEDGIHGSSILAVTFTNKAAREMRERLHNLAGKAASRGVILSTFHSLCARMLRADAHRLDLSNRFTILDTSDQLAQLSRVAKDRGVSLGDEKPRAVLAKIGWFKNQGFAVGGIPPSSDPVHLLAQRLYGPYREHLRALSAVDFDDLLLLVKELLETCGDVRKRYHARFRFLLIDEYQDTNPIQMQLVNLLVGPEKNLCVVGDDDQAIYGFRGSAVENILRFDEVYAPCTVVKLEKNYRSGGAILEAANAVIAHNQHRRDKRLIPAKGPGELPKLLALDDGEGEAEYVAETIKKLLDEGVYTPDDVALLYRANPQSRQFEEKLRLLGVPYRVIGGQEFFERKEVKNVLAYLWLLVDESHELSFRRVVNLPARGIGQKAIEAVIQQAKLTTQGFLHVAHGEDDLGLKPAAREALRSFAVPLLRARRALAEQDAPIDDIADALYSAGIQAQVAREKDLAIREKITSALEETINALSDWWDRVMEARENPDLAESWVVDTSSHPLQSFLDRVALDEEERRREKEKKKEGEKERAAGKVTLMSLHASKGLEFPAVFLVGFEEGLLPHQRVLDEDPVAGIEEERRLCYVGITRAMERLWLTRATVRKKRRRLIPRAPSRFAAELPDGGIEKVGEPDDTRTDEDLAADFFRKMAG